MIVIKKLTLQTLVLSVLVLISFGAHAQGTTGAGDTARYVKVEGSERVDPQTVMAYLKINPGERYTREDLNAALKNLYDTGLFADVTLRQVGDTLVVQVQENPLINRIAFEGNKRIDDEDLETEISSRSRSVLSRSTVKADVDRIKTLYRRKGRFSVIVEPMVIQLDQNRVNLVFEITEGAVSEIRSIKFVGNEQFSDGKLRDVIRSEESRWYKFLSTDDRYDPDRMGYDQELLRRFYLQKGYVDFNIVSAVAELAPDDDAFYVVFTVDEGQRYKVGEVNVQASAIEDADPETLLSASELKTGEWYDAEKMDESIKGIEDILGDMQYAFVDVRPRLDRDRANQTVNVTYAVNPTRRVYVERIDIHGNVRTIDKVIRRELELAEGDPFNKSKLGESESEIRDLGYFEDVTIRPKRGSNPDQTIIDVGVTEQSTGEISIGAGFSTQDGPLADLRIRERNLLGKGQDLLFATTLAGERFEFDISFTEPYFLDRDLQAGVDLFHVTRDLQDTSSYDQQRSGGSLRMGYPLSDDLYQTLRYTLEQNKIDNVGTTASFFVQQQAGTRTTSSVSQRLVYDKRDSKLAPTEGYYTWFDTELAGLGGDVNYVSGKLGGTVYYPITKSTTFSLLGELGNIAAWGNSDEVNISDRYFLGGNNLRGFEVAGVGPRDTATNDSLGGNTFYRASAEVTFPFGLENDYGILGHAFSDMGSLWNTDSNGATVADDGTLRASVGVGMSWRSPFGPIRLDFATPVLEENYDEDEVFRFSFGTRF